MVPAQESEAVYCPVDDGIRLEKVFANPMATAAAIERIAHHLAILELDMSSYRPGVARYRQEEEVSDQQEYLTPIIPLTRRSHVRVSFAALLEEP